MAEIFQIPYSGEARIPMENYDKMRDRIRELEGENMRLTDMLDHVCDENKVRVRRQFIRECYPSTNPHALTQREIIEDKMVNMQDITDELDEKLRTLEKECKEKCEALECSNESISRALEQCQRTKIELEQEVDRLKHRGWWARLWNK